MAGVRGQSQKEMIDGQSARRRDPGPSALRARDGCRLGIHVAGVGIPKSVSTKARGSEDQIRVDLGSETRAVSAGFS